MTTPQLAKLNRETSGLKTFMLFTLLGWLLVGFSILVLGLVLSPTGAAYWIQPKAARDAAEIGSTLLGRLTTLAWWPRLLAPLIFFGVASFMVGIALEFAAIPRILDRRIALLKEAIPLMAANHK